MPMLCKTALDFLICTEVREFTVVNPSIENPNSRQACAASVANTFPQNDFLNLHPISTQGVNADSNFAIIQPVYPNNGR